MTQVLNYHDAIIYDSDVSLFNDGGWLNDNCINWYFRLLEHDVFPGSPEVLFMDPAVVSCMMNQCDEPDEFSDLAKGIDLHSRRLVFVPVNNSQDLMSRGSHWSLLVFERKPGDGFTFRHYDSSSGSNQSSAEKTADQFMIMHTVGKIAEKVPSMVEHVGDAPQQRNSYDCGMYTVLMAERLASEAMTSGSSISSGGGKHGGERGSGIASVTTVSPLFVSEARVFARERLLLCVRDQGR